MARASEVRLVEVGAQFCVGQAPGAWWLDVRHLSIVLHVCKLSDQLNMACFHTAQSRLLRVYIPTCHSPPLVMALVTLAPYIVAVCVPTVIAIRHRPDQVEVPRHLFDELYQHQGRHMSGAMAMTLSREV